MNRISASGRLAVALSLVTYAALNTFLAGGLGVAGRALGLTEAMAGLVLSAGALVGMLAASLWGVAVDAWGQRAVLVVALPALAAGAVLLAVSLGAGTTLLWPGLLLGRVLQAGFGAAMIPCAQSLAAETTAPDRRVNGMGAMAATLSLGTITGSLLLALTAASGLSPGLALLGALGGLSLVLALLGFPPTPRQGRRRALPDGKLVRSLLPYLLVTLAGFATYSMLAPLHGLRLMDNGGLAPGEANSRAGWILLAGAVALFLAQATLARVRPRSSRRMLFLGCLVALPGLIALALSREFLSMALSVTVIGAGLGVASTANLALISLSAGEVAQGTAAGLNATFRSLGLAFGPLIGLVLYGPDTAMPFLVATVLIGAVCLASFRL